ncbi:MAG: hypothetical protein R3C59_17100 [Planctomycetaceae bacterium]
MSTLLRSILLSLAGLLWLQNAALADGPFVAAFDRFSEHGDISLRLSGQMLLSELSCTACHSTDAVELQAKGGPSLDGAGSSLQREWVRQFLLAPSQQKPGTTMPHLLNHLPPGERMAAAEALTAFLMTQIKAFPELKATGVNPIPSQFWKRGDIQQGQALYHRIGCVACHDADPAYETADLKPSPIDAMLDQLEPDEIAELGLAGAARQVKSVPHSALARKYTHQSLTYFLLNPASVRPGGRMPSLKLTAMDAAHVAAWLMSRDNNATDDVRAPDSHRNQETLPDALVTKGRQLFQTLRCSSCHSISGETKPMPARSLAMLNPAAETSCLAGSERQVALPDYSFSAKQIDALVEALGHPADPASHQDAERMKLTMLKLNCYACHERDGLGSIGRFRKAYFETVQHIDIGDEGRLPPSLTHVGRKLKVPWIADVLNGKATVRPHMYIRMPEFPKPQIGELPTALAKADHPQPVRSEQQVFGSLKGLAEDGRILMDVGCVQCHAFRGETLPGSVGVDLEGVADRIHPEWFREFLENPGALKSRTRMPTFFPNGKSQVTDLLHGDMPQQIAAMWAYTKNLSTLPLPQQIEQVRSHNFELTPQQRPIVLRTFMPVAGTHAIAVGFPQHIHVAFDAEQVRFAEAWKGRFLDAQGTWFSRFTPPAEPLAESTMALPAAVPVAPLDRADAVWPDTAEAAGIRFGGYRLTADGVPVFLYRADCLHVEDTMQPDGKETLKRRITILRSSEDSSRSAMFLLHAGKSLEPVADTGMRNAAGLTVTVDRTVAGAAGLRTSNGQTQWLLPIPAKAEVTIEVSYTW